MRAKYLTLLPTIILIASLTIIRDYDVFHPPQVQLYAFHTNIDRNNDYE